MSDLIKITTNEEGKQLVSARELHEKLILEDGLKDIYNMALKKILIMWSAKKFTAASLETGHEVKKVFDANFGAVNAYHEDAWKEVYPEIYNEITK